MPAELIHEMDHYASNRSRFIAEAVAQELKRRRHQALLTSLEEPHPESLATEALGLQTWAQTLPQGDADLLDPGAGLSIHWTSDQGWQESRP